MPRLDELSHLFKLRTVSVLFLLYALSAFALYAESRGFRNWNAMVAGSAALILVFATCYTWSLMAIPRLDTPLLRRLLWAEAIPLVLLHFTMAQAGSLLTFVVFWIARTPNSYRPRTCYWLLGGVVSFFIAVGFIRRTDDIAEIAIVSLLAPLICLFVLAIASTSVNLHRERQRALELNRELQAAQLLLAQSSRSGERLRIAREMHDLLGHQMTALILNLEVSTHKTSGEALEYVERALALARMLLSDLRNAVSDMRENPALDFDAALAELLANVPGLAVTLEREPGLAIHDPRLAEVLLRCTQEALTNTLRHARAHSCHIRLFAQDQQLVLDIRDDGASPARITPGNGLKGMQERLASLAGSLHWHNDRGGFQLRAQLPFPQGSHERMETAMSVWKQP